MVINFVVLENNIRNIYYANPTSAFLAKDDQLVECKILGSRFLGRQYFKLINYFSKGEEVKKTQNLIIQTLHEMQNRMKEEAPRWHFDGIESKYGITGGTYKDFAQRVQKKEFFANNHVVVAKANEIIDAFNKLSFFNLHAPLTADDLISQAIHTTHNPASPSISPAEINAMKKEKNQYPDMKPSIHVFH